MQRRECYFSGHVQGVGFRYTAQSLASRYQGVKGFVRNLPDGRVELVMEGREDEMDQLLEDIRRRMEGLIDDVQVNQSAATGEFGRFSIRH